MKIRICCVGIHRHYSDKLAKEFDKFRKKRVHIQTRARRNTHTYDPIEAYLLSNFHERDGWHQQIAQAKAFKKHTYKNRLKRQKNENLGFLINKPELKPEFKPKFLWGLNQHVPFELFKNLELGACVFKQIKQESFHRLEIQVWEQMSQELDFFNEACSSWEQAPKPQQIGSDANSEPNLDLWNAVDLSELFDGLSFSWANTSELTRLTSSQMSVYAPWLAGISATLFSLSQYGSNLNHTTHG